MCGAQNKALASPTSRHYFHLVNEGNDRDGQHRPDGDDRNLGGANLLCVRARAAAWSRTADPAGLLRGIVADVPGLSTGASYRWREPSARPPAELPAATDVSATNPAIPAVLQRWDGREFLSTAAMTLAPFHRGKQENPARLCADPADDPRHPDCRGGDCACFAWCVFGGQFPAQPLLRCFPLPGTGI